ncbi:EID1-like F-box protein 3 [Dichanthelium oligosanthes]|uniref:EID1-like F-box protein 3 n=1 Tax=Dichanthelium oligosanthes TaxID=888268 RepID=A0A1E5W4P4_9POAL|nr:EID1-like F-box protein 3 [Dichanthelium oligosanthes]
MSEGARNTRRFYGSSSSGAGGSGTGGASYRDGGGIGAARTSDVNTGILDENVLALVFRCINFDPKALCTVACVSRRLRAVAERVLWRELCVSRAPRMVASLTGAAAGVPGAAPAPPGRIVGGWPALAKLLLFCCGAAAAAVPGHFTGVSRFSKTSGRSFLSRRCRGDLLYVSDPCEHAAPGSDDDVGAYRGVFRGFTRSRTRACLVGRQAALETRVRCPYCGARVWSMVAAGLVPRSACRRLGAYEGRLEYYVCVSGHLHGNCWLARLTSSDVDHDDGSDSDSDDSHVAS